MPKKLPDLVIGDLKINPPIIQGGMGVRVSAVSLVSAVSKTGALGVLASVGLGEEGLGHLSYEERSREAFRQMILDVKSRTAHPFGVNIMFALTNFDDLAKVAFEENVAVIASGAGLPLHLPALASNQTTKLAPIISSDRAADLICKTWLRRYKRLPDALILEGPLAGGHLGFKFTELVSDEFPDLEKLLDEVLVVVRTYEKEADRHIPIIAGGGVFTGKDVARLLKRGASGVQMATRFVCTQECDAAEAYKRAYLNCGEQDIVIILSPAGMPARVIKNKFVERIQSGERMNFNCPYRCLKTCDPYTANYCIAAALVSAYRGDLENGFAMSGANAWRIKQIVPVKELIDEIVEEAISSYAAMR